MNIYRIIGLIIAIIGGVIMFTWDSEYDFLLGFLIGGGIALLFSGKPKGLK